MGNKKIMLLAIVMCFAVIITNLPLSHAADWVTLNGEVTSGDGTPLCALVLANGEFMFSCDPSGDYSIYVPFDEDNKITLFAFCDGYLPFKQILTSVNNPTDISLSKCQCLPDSETGDCENIVGSWTDTVSATLEIKSGSTEDSNTTTASRSVEINQDGCYTEWKYNSEPSDFERNGMITGDTFTLTGEVLNGAIFKEFMEEYMAQLGYDIEITITLNTHSGNGNIYGEVISYSGIGNITGSLYYQGSSENFSVKMTETSSLTKNSIKNSYSTYVYEEEASPFHKDMMNGVLEFFNFKHE